MLPRVHPAPSGSQAQPSPFEKEQKRRLRVVPEPEKPREEPNPPPDEGAGSPETGKQHPRSLGLTFHQILGQITRLPFVRALGVLAYQTTLRLSKRTGRTRKGALVDFKAE